MGAIEKSFGFNDLPVSDEKSVFMTGIQALVRLPMLQRQLDRERGLNTAGLISGYRGSPLGAYDQQLWKAAKELNAHDVLFQPGLNEDLAATALWGTQMHAAYGDTRYDGVFGIWYGKGPGVDRTGDVFRTANILGTSKLGGVLAVSGDDHAAQSSMYPHQTDGIFQAASMPILQPANVKEIIEFGLAGFALSRYSGLWVGLKTIAEVVESAASFYLGAMPAFRLPEDFQLPVHGLNWDPKLAWPGQRAELERRLIEERLPAARAWARANMLDRSIVTARDKRFGIVTVGKAHQDVMQAFDDLGLTAREVADLGISIYKVGMSWPLETTGMLSFAQGQEEILVVEEKRSIVETQIKEALYHQSGTRPRVVGKTAESGKSLLPETSEFSPKLIARVLAQRFGEEVPILRQRFDAVGISRPLKAHGVIPIRRPYFCSGCPHNSSTKVPNGSVAGGGIGCHVMALSQPELRTKTFSQMGGEGAQWIGAAPFSATEHIFQNLGDGTYQHSGLLAIRAAVAAKTNITYKILYNDAVAMTGGQAAEGQLTPERITRQLAAEGVQRIEFVSDRPQHWIGNKDLAPQVRVHPREKLDEVQQELRVVPGVTAIVYEQTCAAEKRRRRKRKEYPDPDKRIFINHRVCEGCGDCSIQSNCISIEPIETSFGRKRQINQNACNKDFSCVKGFCPSFIEIEGARVRKPDSKRLELLETEMAARLTPPVIPGLNAPFNIIITGIGGTGVLTMGALIGGAAHLEGKGSTVLDFTGLAQKNGAVISQVRIAQAADRIHAVRIGDGAADLVIGTDLLVAAGMDVLGKVSSARTAAVVNIGEVPTADIVSQRDASLPVDLMLERLGAACDDKAFFNVNATELAQKIFGDTVIAHTLMLGYAWQAGLVPLSKEAIERAIELNGASVALNKRAFTWGRIAAAEPGILKMLDEGAEAQTESPQSLDELVQHYVDELIRYQDRRYADRFLALVRSARMAEQTAMPGEESFGYAVARSAFKLMAYKDEYEVARLYSSDEFKSSLSAQFSELKRASVWLSPPLLSRIDPATGRPRKQRFGTWVFTAFKLMSRMKALRGTPLDPFGYTEERRSEKRLINDYFERVQQLVNVLSESNHAALVEAARLPLDIRGYGPVKREAMKEYEARWEAMAHRLG